MTTKVNTSVLDITNLRGYAAALSVGNANIAAKSNVSTVVTGLTASNVYTALGIYPVSNTDGQIDSLGVGMEASGVSGEIRATDNVTAYYFSDVSVKTNIKDIPEALVKVTHISGKTFDWTDEYIQERGGEDGYFVQKSDFGVIAQDVQSVFPTAVRVKPNGKLAVDYEKLSALAFAAIRELSLEMQDLKAKMQDLESKINANS